MSARIYVNRIIATLVATAAVFAVVAAATAGLGYWPVSAAFAGHGGGSAMLGVDADTAVALGPKVTPAEKFSASAGSSVQALPKALVATSAKKAAPVPKATPAKRISVAQAASKSAPKKSGKSTASNGSWKSARCSTYGIGDGLVGHGMAGGGKLRADSMVVAHKTLPFGTKIRFSYKGRTCIAEVRDRGPFVSGRVFDLGPGTAKSLGFSGVGTVKYQIVSR